MSALTFNPRTVLDRREEDGPNAKGANPANPKTPDMRGLVRLAGLAGVASPPCKTAPALNGVALSHASPEQQADGAAEWLAIGADLPASARAAGAVFGCEPPQPEPKCPILSTVEPDRSMHATARLTDGYHQAVLRRPSSWWRAEMHQPTKGATCSCCSGQRWWSRDGQGWNCHTCHSPLVLPSAEL